jgi:hypothetical protein
MPNDGPIVSLEPQPFEVTVPSDAAHVELWNRNCTTFDHGCEAWDSRFGDPAFLHDARWRQTQTFVRKGRIVRIKLQQAR